MSRLRSIFTPLILLLILPLLCIAAEENLTSRQTKHFIGCNLTSSSTAEHGFSMSYGYQLTPRWFIQSSIMFKVHEEYTRTEDIQRHLDQFNSTFYTNSRKEHGIQVSAHLLLLVPMRDAVNFTVSLGPTFSKSLSDEAEFIDSTVLGLKFVLGTEWKFSKRISLKCGSEIEVNYSRLTNENYYDQDSGIFGPAEITEWGINTSAMTIGICFYY